MTHFLLLSMPRSGTNMLRNMLNEHPRIQCRGEVAYRYSDWNYTHERLPLVPFIRDRIWGSNEVRDVRGFTCHLYHPLDSLYQCVNGRGDRALHDAFWDFIVSDDLLRIVHLCRANFLARFLSEQLAKEHRRWQVTTQEAEFHPRETVKLDVKAFLNEHRLYTRLEADRLALLAHKPMLRITYEDLVSDTKGVSRRVVDFLGVSPVPLEVRTQKLETRPLHEIVENYDEVSTALSRAGLREFLVD